MPSAAPPVSTALTLHLEPELARALQEAAAAKGWRPELLAEECMRQNLEIATRHRVLLESMEGLHAAIMEMANQIGELSAPSGGIDLTGVCRYPKTKKAPV